jgi:hypothetical protein
VISSEISAASGNRERRQRCQPGAERTGAAMPPTVPSTVFDGDSCGAIGWRPASLSPEVLQHIADLRRRGAGRPAARVFRGIAADLQRQQRRNVRDAKHADQQPVPQRADAQQECAGCSPHSSPQQWQCDEHHAGDQCRIEQRNFRSRPAGIAAARRGRSSIQRSARGIACRLDGEFPQRGQRRQGKQQRRRCGRRATPGRRR